MARKSSARPQADALEPDAEELFADASAEDARAAVRQLRASALAEGMFDAEDLDAGEREVLGGRTLIEHVASLPEADRAAFLRAAADADSLAVEAGEDRGGHLRDAEEDGNSEPTSAPEIIDVAARVAAAGGSDWRSRNAASPLPADADRLLNDLLMHRGWARREGQVQMVHAIDGAIRDGGPGIDVNVAINAPVGTGKTLGYLVAALARGERIVIATSTKGLQDQIMGEELPELAADLRALYGYHLTYGTLKGRSNYWCLTGETEVITWNGTLPIKQLAETNIDPSTGAGVHRIIDGDGKWVYAPFRSYGQQRVWEIALTRGNQRRLIRTTAEHRWFVQPNGKSPCIEEVTTDQLKPGARLAWVGTQAAIHNITPSPFGVAHGVVQGDGTVFAPTANGFRTGTLVLHGDKIALAERYFHGSRTSELEPSENGVPALRVWDLPSGFKRLPDIDEAPSYLAGWLAGYIATDASVDSSGTVYLSSATLAHLKFAETVCARLGIVTQGIKGGIRGPSHLGRGGPDGEMYRLIIDGHTLPDSMYLLDKHRTLTPEERSDNNRYKHWKVRRRWKIESVTPTESLEEVYCAEVPTTQSFVLTDNILTGNCSGSARALIDGRVGRNADAEEEALFGEVEVPDSSVVEIVKTALAATEERIAAGTEAGFDGETELRAVPASVRRSLTASKRCAARAEPWVDRRPAEDGDDVGWLDADTDYRPGELAELPCQIAAAAGGCHYRAAYAHAMASQVIVLNTTLLVYEIMKAMRGGQNALAPALLKDAGLVIVDEAHHLFSIISEAYALEINFGDLIKEIEDVERKLTRRYTSEPKEGPAETAPAWFAELNAETRGLVRDLDDVIDDHEHRRLRDAEYRAELRDLLGGFTRRAADWSDRVTAFASDRERAKPSGLKLTATGVPKVVNSLLYRLGEKVGEVGTLASNAMAGAHEEGRRDANYHFSLSVADADAEDLWIKSVPIDVTFFRRDLAYCARMLNPFVPARADDSSVVALSSGTITERTPVVVGMDDPAYLDVESPFDPSRVRVYVPNIPEPKDRDWPEESWAEIKDAVRAIGGRTLVLTTSLRMMNQYAEWARAELRGFTVLAQSDAGATKMGLVEALRTTPRAVLFGTRSFWEGVNIPGPPLSLVVVDKIMFPNPDDAVMKAQKEYLLRQGASTGEAFAKVDVDYAAVMLAQGTGRAIRAVEDTAGIMILDKRVLRAGYASKVTKLLPERWPVTQDADAFLDFLEAINPDRGGDPLNPPPIDPELWSPMRKPAHATRSIGRGR